MAHPSPTTPPRKHKTFSWKVRPFELTLGGAPSRHQSLIVVLIGLPFNRSPTDAPMASQPQPPAPSPSDDPLTRPQQGESSDSQPSGEADVAQLPPIPKVSDPAERGKQLDPSLRASKPPAPSTDTIPERAPAPKVYPTVVTKAQAAAVQKAEAAAEVLNRVRPQVARAAQWNDANELIRMIDTRAEAVRIRVSCALRVSLSARR